LRNLLLTAQPYEVEKALRQLGENLRTARLRRNLTVEDAAAKIGTGIRAVMDAEKGKASTGIAIYTALLWAYDLLSPFDELANPLADKEGIALAASKENKRARKPKGLSNDF
jgi:transcriptional regulator with XRE-family HTH domain